MKNKEFGKFETKEVPSPTPTLDEALAKLPPITADLCLKELRVSQTTKKNLVNKIDTGTLTQKDIEKKLINLSKKGWGAEKKQQELLLFIIFSLPTGYGGNLKKLPLE